MVSSFGQFSTYFGKFCFPNSEVVVGQGLGHPTDLFDGEGGFHARKTMTWNVAVERVFTGLQ